MVAARPSLPKHRLRPATVPALSSVVVCLAIAALIIGGGIARTGHGLWLWRTGGGVQVVDGAALAWEWVDLAYGAWFFDADARWTSGGVRYSVHVLRFVPGVVVSLLGGWIGDAWRAAILATLLCWFAAAAAMYWLCRSLVAGRARGHRIGCVAALLVALSPGFTAYMGNVESRPFAYAAAPLALLVLERARALRLARIHPALRSDKRHHPVVLGAVLFLANATLELGPPLLIMLWVLYVFLDEGTDRPALAERVRSAATVTAGYLLLVVAWRMIIWVVTAKPIAVSEDNDAWYRLVDNLLYARPDLSTVTARLWNVQVNSIPTFTAPVVALLIPGLLVLPRRASLWAIVWTCTIIAAILITRQYPRTLYLAFPGVYLAAAAAVERMGTLAAGWMTLRRGGARAALLWLPPVGFLYGVGSLVLADLAGDLTLPRSWWPK